MKQKIPRTMIQMSLTDIDLYFGEPWNGKSGLGIAPWIVALYAIDAFGNPRRLITLLKRGRVPKAAMPYVVDLLNRKLTWRPKGGRPPLPLYAYPNDHLLAAIVDTIYEEEGAANDDEAIDKLISKYPSVRINKQIFARYYSRKSGASHRYWPGIARATLWLPEVPEEKRRKRKR
jgi:hypothetical protein